jgi:hypothetical protein
MAIFPVGEIAFANVMRKVHSPFGRRIIELCPPLVGPRLVAATV